MTQHIDFSGFMYKYYGDKLPEHGVYGEIAIIRCADGSYEQYIWTDKYAALGAVSNNGYYAEEQLGQVNCPNCAAPIERNMRECPYCGTPYIKMRKVSKE